MRSYAEYRAKKRAHVCCEGDEQYSSFVEITLIEFTRSHHDFLAGKVAYVSFFNEVLKKRFLKLCCNGEFKAVWQIIGESDFVEGLIVCFVPFWKLQKC